MKIIVGKTAGFCYGVKKAVLATNKILQENKSAYCIGEIVHNGEVIKELSKKGLKIIDNIEEAKEKIIIRAHGIPKETYNKAKQLNIEVCDYTCPNVLKIHKLAEEYEQKGYYIFLIGIKTHPETIGTISFCGYNSYIIEKDEDISEAISKLKQTNINKVLVLVQTTFSIEKFNKYIEIIKEKLRDNSIKIDVKNTICNATKIRQEETEEISKNVECMIIIGGKNSSNTKKLYDISKEICKHTIIIENKDELNIDIIKKFNRIGIMAGASTPAKSINELIEKINNET